MRSTGVAAAKTALPTWLAVTPQLPTPIRESTVPLTVHTAGVVELKTTTNPEVAVATRAEGCAPRTWLPGEVKLMFCATRATTKVCIAAGAAAKFWSPPWLATTVQLPPASSDKLLPVTPQTLGVVEVKVTGRPEDAAATRAAGATLSTWLPGDAKEIDCACPRVLMANVTATGVAAR